MRMRSKDFQEAPDDLAVDRGQESIAGLHNRRPAAPLLCESGRRLEYKRKPLPVWKGIRMERVNCGKYLLAVLLLVLFVPPVLSQEAVMILNHREVGAQGRPPVRFDHERHAGKFECARCHHDFDEHLNNRGGEDKAQPCANCHAQNTRQGVIPLTEAFHAQCKQCHERTGSERKTGGPVMCGECHAAGSDLRN